MEPTWVTRDLPVLRAVAELYDAQLPSTFGVGPQAVVEATGLPRVEVDRAVFALVDSSLLSRHTDLRGGDRITSWRVTGVSERARRLVGQWPSPEQLVADLVVALDKVAESEPDPDKKSKLKAGALAVGSLAKDVVTNVVANLIAGGMM